MSEEKHTPGPWAVHIFNDGIMITNSSGSNVADADPVWCAASTIEEQKANAHLIANAPRQKEINGELLDALYDCLVELEGLLASKHYFAETQGVFDKALAVYKKSGGKKG